MGIFIQIPLSVAVEWCMWYEIFVVERVAAFSAAVVRIER